MSTSTRDLSTELGSSSDSTPLSEGRFRQLCRVLADRYEIGDEVGRGATAHVFRARDLQRGQEVALKILRPELTAAVAEMRFLREIDVVRKLEHPNVLPVLDSGSADGQVYFSMPLVNGHTLRRRLRETGPLPIDEVISIGRDVASALDYAHERGLVHRDIKPSNTLLDGERGRVFVTDFGIARAVAVASGDQLTDSGTSVGTPEYMSPEQAVGQRQLDGRCDVYSLGCMVYEMLSGAPPFAGPTSQAIIARQCHEPPPPLHVVRPTVSEAMERVVERALAKVPADRYATAGEFINELEIAVNAPPAARRRTTVKRVAVAAAVMAAVVTGAWWSVRPTREDLDSKRIVVFPLSTSGLEAGEPSGEAVATAIGYTLEGTRPLRWLVGWELLDKPSRSDTARLTRAEAQRLSLKAHAGYFIHGTIIGSADSVSVSLELSSVAGDSVIAGKTETAARGAFIPNLALRAVTTLMMTLLKTKTLDVSPLSNRPAAAVLNFLQGEADYRRMDFAKALEHDSAAVSMDSSFALAALRGAQSADWLSRPDRDSALVEMALSHEASLPVLQRMIARGLRAYANGDADSAVHYLEKAIALEPEHAATWAMLGEVYSRMLPARGPADSLSEQAFLRARQLDADFAPALIQLERLAFRRGDLVAAKRLAEELKAANADTSHAFARDLMTRCLERGASAVDWKGAVRREAEAVLEVGKLMSAGGKQPVCGRAAVLALLTADTSVVPLNYRWVSLLILKGIDETLGLAPNDAELHGPGVARLPMWVLSGLVAAGTPELDRTRRHALDSLASSYQTLSTRHLWYLGLIAFRLRDEAALASIQRAIESRADSSGARMDRLVAGEVSARLKLVQGDSSVAIKQLRALKPTARRNDIAWQPWESLAAERMLLAELLLARGDARGAIDVASLLDAPEPAAYLYYLRQSLVLRARAAERLRDTPLMESYRARISQLDTSAALVADRRSTK